MRAVAVGAPRGAVVPHPRRAPVVGVRVRLPLVPVARGALLDERHLPVQVARRLHPVPAVAGDAGRRRVAVQRSRRLGLRARGHAVDVVERQRGHRVVAACAAQRDPQRDPVGGRVAHRLDHVRAVADRAAHPVLVDVAGLELPVPVAHHAPPRERAPAVAPFQLLRRAHVMAAVTRLAAGLGQPVAPAVRACPPQRVGRRMTGPARQGGARLRRMRQQPRNRVTPQARDVRVHRALQHRPAHQQRVGVVALRRRTRQELAIGVAQFALGARPALPRCTSHRLRRRGGGQGEGGESENGGARQHRASHRPSPTSTRPSPRNTKPSVTLVTTSQRGAGGAARSATARRLTA